MKRYLKNNQHQLSAHEREEVWRGIQQRTGRGAQPRPRARRFTLPAFGLTVLTAAVLLAAVWLHDPDAPEKIAAQGRQDRPLIGADRAPVEVVAVPEIQPEAQPQPKAEPAPGPEPAPKAEPRSESEAHSLRDAVARMEKEKEKNLTFQTAPVDVAGDPAPAKVAGNTKSVGNGTVPPPPKAVAPAPEQPSAAPLKPGIMGRSKGGTGHEVFEKVEMADNLLGGKISAGQEYGGNEVQALDSARRLAAAPLEAPAGSVTGGTTPPNGETFELMYHEHTGVNPFVATEEDALSTFAVDVDNASYTLARSYLQRGALPPQAAIRVEEFVNFFGGGYPDQTRDVFRIATDGAPSRFGAGYQLLRVGLKGKTIDATGRKPANLVFVIDTSGSMGHEGRLELVKRSLHLLLEELDEGDRVGLVTYGSSGQVVLEPTGVDRRERIAAAIDALQPGGGTNACEGLDLAYDLARRHYEAGLVNRLILCSDGVANLGGATRAEEMLARVRRSSDEGITLSAVGVGMGNYNDVLLEKLADQGDGNYFYVDKLDEAERVFRQNLTGLLQTIAREVKVQVEFDPRQVQRWRLLGYENRDVADRDFRNDAVDAGEVGAGHEVTALYELKVTAGDDNLGVVRVRYEHPAHDTARAGQVEEIEHPIRRRDLATGWDRSRPELRLQAVAAEFAEILRGSFWARESSLADLVAAADGVAEDLPGHAQARELAELVRRAADLQAAQKARETAPAEDR